MRSSVWIGMALSAVSLAISLAALEVCLRVWRWPHGGFRSTRLTTVASSGPGQPDFRSRSYELDPRPDVFRILTVGDSFAWGGGVHPEDAFPDRLESRLNAMHGNSEFEIVNWSRPGWNTVQEFRSLSDRFEQIAPDLLLLGFVLNDPEPSSRQDRARGLAESEVTRRRPGHGASTFLYRHSRLYELVWTRLENLRQRRALRAYYPSLYEGQGWRACRAALRRFRHAASELGIPVVLVILPVFESRFDDSYPYARLHEMTRRVGERLEMRTLDLLPVYRGVDPHRLAVEPGWDAHPSELAHRMAADAILDYLLEEGLVPSSAGIR